MRFTVLGASGFIGRHLAFHLRRCGHEVEAPGRDRLPALEGDAGHVVYAIGVTGDFRRRPYETIDAHVNVLGEVLRRLEFHSFLYLSSTRVYSPAVASPSTREDDPVAVSPSADAIYDLSKLLGEALCLSHPSPAVRVARLSNVYGPGQSPHTFLGAVIESLVRHGSVEFGEAPQSSKDYVAVGDVVALIEKIALSGEKRRYNVASGRRTSHGEIARLIAADGRFGSSFAAGAPVRAFPPIDISRVKAEFGFSPRSLIDDFIGLADEALVRAQGPRPDNRKAR
jgi:nucleoside-diphosphate-sugar epimerase